MFIWMVYRFLIVLTVLISLITLCFNAVHNGFMIELVFRSNSAI